MNLKRTLACVCSVLLLPVISASTLSAREAIVCFVLPDNITAEGLAPENICTENSIPGTLSGNESMCSADKPNTLPVRHFSGNTYNIEMTAEVNRAEITVQHREAASYPGEAMETGNDIPASCDHSRAVSVIYSDVCERLSKSNCFCARAAGRSNGPHHRSIGKFPGMTMHETNRPILISENNGKVSKDVLCEDLENRKTAQTGLTTRYNY